MPRPPASRPTDREIEILRVLWRTGPSTVREVQRELGPDVGYTTALKLMQIMDGKGLVTRDTSTRPQRYAAAAERGKTERSMVRDLLTRVFGGSTESLVLHALSERPTTADERRRIRELLDDLEERGGDPADARDDDGGDGQGASR